MNTKIKSIKVKDLNGASIDVITTYSNQIVLLLIYNNDCLGCTGRALPLAYRFQQDYPDIQVVGIHSNFPNRVGSKASIKRIFTSGEIPFPIYIDDGHQVFDQLNAEGTPHWILITAQQELYRSIFGSQENAQNRLYYAIESLLETEN